MFLSRKLKLNVMNKAILTIASSIVLTVLGAAFVPVGSAPAIGYQAPGITLEADAQDKGFALDAYKGKPLLLTFWATTDAASRVACGEYDRFAKTHGDKEQLAFVALNLDPSEGVYEMTLRHDGLTEDSHRHLDNTQSARVIEDYQMADGLKAFLIDADGKIVAVNPDADTISEMLGQ